MTKTSLRSSKVMGFPWKKESICMLVEELNGMTLDNQKWSGQAWLFQTSISVQGGFDQQLLHSVCVA